MNKQELTLGEVRSMYFDDATLELPPVTLYRLDVKGSRHYFSISDLVNTNDEPQLDFYSGVTSVTSATLPKAEQLVKWIADMGYNEAIKYRDERASYGTLMHTVFAHVLINGSLDLQFVDSLVHEYCQRENRVVNIWQWSEDIKQDVIAFAQWVSDYDVKPLAIEISLCSPSGRFAGTVDLPCLMTIPTKGDWGEVYKSGEKKGQPKITTQDIRTMAIVDFKSGRKSYGGMVDCAAQLRLYKALWVENFGNQWRDGQTRFTPPDAEGEIRLFNWSPKDWRTNPGYHLAEQTDSFSEAQMEAMLDMYQLSQKPIEEKTKTFYSGVVTMGVDPKENYQVKTVPELANEKLADKDAPVGAWEYLTVDDLVSSVNEANGAYDLFSPKGKKISDD